MLVRIPAAITATLPLVFMFAATSPLAAQFPPVDSVRVTLPAVESSAGQPVQLQSKNFLVCGVAEPVARRVAAHAERRRREMAKRWLGKELPDWPRACRIEVRLDDGRIGGMTTSDFAAPANSWAPTRICVTGSVDRILNNILPHEMTHAILADHFRRPLPKWADEGMAVLGDDAVEQKKFERMAREMYAPGQLYTLEYLLPLPGYPEHVGTLYAQGYSVTRFLIGLKDRETFLAFVATGMEGDWPAAVKQYYGYDSVGQLQAAWLATIKENPAAK